MTGRLRVMVVSHGHPDIGAGGAEHAAFTLFSELRSRPDTTAIFVARIPASRGGASALSQHVPDGSELLVASDTEHFRHSQRRIELINEEFPELLRWYEPDVVHFHHYTHLGLELLRAVRNYSPAVPIVMTLHEYLAICHANGQLVRTTDRSPCERPSPAACNACFPEISAEDFFLRERFIKSYLALVDQFVAPSRFLAERYARWGLDPQRFTVLENPLSCSAVGGGGRDEGSDRFARRFAFFGQVHPNKGLHVLLRAVQLLPTSLLVGADRVAVGIHGSRLEEQSSDYRATIERLLQATARLVTYQGPYARERIGALMWDVDWVVVPSTWWENSPTVIQEAFANGVPVITGDGGGMAEKVTDGVNGLLFRMGDARHLAERMTEAATTPGLRRSLSSGIPQVEPAEIITAKHVEIYRALTSGRAAALAGSS